MLSLVAISKADGWAVVKDSDGLLLVRPPYRASNQRRVAESYLAEAISRHGFVRPEGAQDFAGWQPLIEHLNAEVAQARRMVGQTLDDLKLGEKLVDLVPETVLLGFIERARIEQLPDPAAWPAAESLVTAILRAPQAATSTELRNSALDLLDDLRKATSQREGLVAPPSVNGRTEEEQENLRAAYAVLYARYNMNTDILWRVITLVLATEAALFVGLIQLNKSDLPQWYAPLLGLGVFMLGTVGPLSVRFVESVILIDRILLDEYEEEMLKREDRRLLHGHRFRDRQLLVYQRLESGDKATLNKRRISPVDKEGRADAALDILGQASIVWTAVMAFAGAVGLTTGMADVIESPTLLLAISVAALLVTAGLWFAANGWLHALLAAPMRLRDAVLHRVHRQRHRPESDESASAS